MRLDALATQIHYAEHAHAMLEILRPEQAGSLWVTEALLEECLARGLYRARPSSERRLTGWPTLVCSYSDLQLARQLGGVIAYAEHGVGQTYRDCTRPDGYPGGEREGVSLVLVPNERAERAYSRLTCPVVVAGSPRGAELRSARRAGVREPYPALCVALAWHWGCGVSPEAGATWRDWWPQVERAVRESPRWMPGRRVSWIGHGHPRLLRPGSPLWGAYEALGIPVEPVLDRALERCDVLAVDNSSVAWEAAAADCPVLLLDHPSYRRDVRHGLRFWSEARVGERVSLESCRRDPQCLLLQALDYASHSHGIPEVRSEAETSANLVAPPPDVRAVQEAVDRLLQECAAAPPNVNTVDVRNDEPTLRALCLRSFSGPEGEVHEGEVFYPGWTHLRVSPEGRSSLVPDRLAHPHHPRHRLAELAATGHARRLDVLPADDPLREKLRDEADGWVSAQEMFAQSLTVREVVERLNLPTEYEVRPLVPDPGLEQMQEFPHMPFPSNRDAVVVKPESEEELIRFADSLEDGQ